MQPSVSNSTEARHLHHAPDANRSAKTKSLIWHLFQMFIAMAIGHALYQMVFVNLLAPVSYKDYLQSHTLFNYWSMMLAMLVPIVLLPVLVLAGVISLMTLKGLGMPLMTLGMALHRVWRRR